MTLKILDQLGRWETICKGRRVTQGRWFFMSKPILIIDDDQSIRRALRLLLESHSFEVKEAEDGLEALALLDRGLSVDVILSDYQMPVIDGVSFLKALAYRTSGQGVNVILLSGNMTKKIEQVAKTAGAFAVIAKPYDPENLLDLISCAVSLRDS